MHQSIKCGQKSLLFIIAVSTFATSNIAVGGILDNILVLPKGEHKLKERHKAGEDEASYKSFKYDEGFQSYLESVKKVTAKNSKSIQPFEWKSKGFDNCSKK